MQRAQSLEQAADWLVRSQHNRSLPGGGRLWERVSAGVPLGMIRFTLKARPGQRAREVRQAVWKLPVWWPKRLPRPPVSALWNGAC